MILALTRRQNGNRIAASVGPEGGAGLRSDLFGAPESVRNCSATPKWGHNL